MLYGNSIVGILITFCASSVLVFGFEHPGTYTFKSIWWLMVCVVLFTRAIDAIWWKKQHLMPDYDGRKATQRYIFGSCFTAFLWCIYSLYTLGHAEIIELATNIVIVSALAGGAATILAGHRYASMAYSFIILVPYSLALTFSQEDYKFLLGSLGICFAGVLMLTANKSASFTLQSIRFKNENKVLVQQMEEQVARRTQKIHELSNLDPLTGLLNRTAFLSQLEEILSYSKSSHQSLAILFIDLDKFKKINDAVGHDTGDQVLTRTTDRLKILCQDQELLCRWGGDEFIMAIPKVDRRGALEKAATIIERLSKPLKFDQNRLAIGATIGISMFPEHSQSAEMLIRLADTAMYDQKNRATSKAFIFSEELGKKINREHRLKAGLAQAISKRQLKLVFQPIILARNNRTVAFEALLRWQFGNEHVYPNEFIGIAEQYGMIQSIGAWVLDEACRIASKWDRSKNISVTVNVSVMQIQDEGFVNLVRETLEKYQLPADLLGLEITESILASEQEIIIEKIESLKQLGVWVLIDDFGTGYSSLSSLHELPVDIVKIDSSFVKTMDAKGLHVIRAVIDIASSLNYFVVAEGVEEARQAEKLNSLGIGSQQGYYFARPLEYDQINGYLAHSSRTETATV